MQMRPSSLTRAAGAAVAAAGAGRAPASLRFLLLGGSDMAARRIDPVGLQPLAITPSGDLDVLSSMKPDLVTTLSGAASWAALNLGVDVLLRRMRIPAVLRGAAVGAAVYFADVTVSAQVATKGAVAEAAADLA